MIKIFHSTAMHLDCITDLLNTESGFVVFSALGTLHKKYAKRAEADSIEVRTRDKMTPSVFYEAILLLKKQ
jgi:hypothetical protein